MLSPGVGRKASDNKRLQCRPVLSLCHFWARRLLVCPLILAPPVGGEPLVPEWWCPPPLHGFGGLEAAQQEGLAMVSGWQGPLEGRPSPLVRKGDRRGQGTDGLGPEATGQSWVFPLNGATLATPGCT